MHYMFPVEDNWRSSTVVHFMDPSEAVRAGD
jgi:hypothetical protein